jgi:hypothetical protein
VIPVPAKPDHDPIDPFSEHLILAASALRRLAQEGVDLLDYLRSLNSDDSFLERAIRAYDPSLVRPTPEAGPVQLPENIDEGQLIVLMMSLLGKTLQSPEDVPLVRKYATRETLQELLPEDLSERDLRIFLRKYGLESGSPLKPAMMAPSYHLTAVKCGQIAAAVHRKMRAKLHAILVANEGADKVMLEDVEWLGHQSFILKGVGIETLAQLTTLTEDDLLRLTNFSASDVEEIKAELAWLGLSLAG